jgi:hypothetical protein
MLRTSSSSKLTLMMRKPAVSILLTTAKYWGPETVSWRGCPGGLGSLQFEENAFHSKERNIVIVYLPAGRLVKGEISDIFFQFSHSNFAEYLPMEFIMVFSNYFTLYFLWLSSHEIVDWQYKKNTTEGRKSLFEKVVLSSADKNLLTNSNLTVNSSSGYSLILVLCVIVKFLITCRSWSAKWISNWKFVIFQQTRQNQFNFHLCMFVISSCLWCWISFVRLVCSVSMSARQTCNYFSQITGIDYSHSFDLSYITSSCIVCSSQWSCQKESSSFNFCYIFERYMSVYFFSWNCFIFQAFLRETRIKYHKFVCYF